MSLKLVLPNKKYLKSWQNFIRDAIANGESEESPHYEKHLAATKMSDYFTRLRNDRLGKNLDKGMVPQTVYWAIVNDQVVGRISFRHRLNKVLREYGGHIGYAVRPAKQRKGYATEMLRQLLLKLDKTTYKKILITCDADNIPSRRTIERNGGRLKKTDYDFNGRLSCWYWITLG